MPKENSAWPPLAWQAAYLAYSENAAWWGGDAAELISLYGSNGGNTHGMAAAAKATRTARRQRSRFLFWGRGGDSPVPDRQPARRHHLPAAANLATYSSDLQFAQSPTFLIPGKDSDADSADVQLLNEIMNTDRSLSQLGAYGETKAALGAAISVPMWDTELAPGEVWWESFGPDSAIPTFRSGRLLDVTLWSEMVEGNVYWRLLAHHAVENKRGYIEYALFQGGKSTLGKRVELTAHELGESYADIVDHESRQYTGLDRLDAVYGINTPSIEWRLDPVLRYAGRSDFAQLHGLFDDLDRIWSSLIRDIRQGVGRTFLPSSYLTSMGRGKGAAFDDIAEYVTQLNMPGDINESGKLPIHHQQHQIRVDEHEQSIALTYKEILRKAGYSPSAWGDSGEQGGQITAREVEDRNAASERTRAKKNMHDRTTLGALARNMMGIHAHLFKSKGYDPKVTPTVDFPEISQESPKTIAETVAMLNAAGAISLMQSVARANPGWQPSQVTAEVEQIMRERGQEMPDPATLGRVTEAIESEDGEPDDDEQ